MTTEPAGETPAARSYREAVEWAELATAVAEVAAGVPARATQIERWLAALPAAPVTEPPGDVQAGQVPAEAARAYLLTHVDADGPAGAMEQIAGTLADLLARVPQALALAARHLNEVDGGDPVKFRDRYLAAAPRLWTVGVPPGCPEPVARACLLGLEHLAATSPPGHQLLELCGCLETGAEIPVNWLLAGGDLLPPALRAATVDHQVLAEAIGAPARLGLLTRTGGSVRVDPLVQVALDHLLGDGPARRRQAAALVLAAFPRVEPGSGIRAEDAPRAAALLPHLLRLAVTVGEDLPGLTSAMLDRIARYHLESGALPEAEQVAVRALEVRERALAAATAGIPAAGALAEVAELELLPVLDLLAEIRAGLRDEAGQRATLDRSLAIQEAGFAGDPAAMVEPLRRRADALVRLGDLPAAREALERALRIVEAQPDGIPEIRLSILDKLSGLLPDLGDPAAAIAAHQRALALSEQSFGPDDPELLKTLAPLATLLREQGDLVAARAALERALSILEVTFNPDYPQEWIGRALLGVLAELGDRPAVTATVDRLLDLYAPHAGFRYPELAGVLDRLVDLLVRQEDHAGAAVALERIIAAESAETGYGGSHPKVIATLRRLAEVQRQQGNLNAAVGTLERLVAATGQRYGEQHENVVAVLLELGEARAALGDLTAALPDFKRVFAIASRVYGSRSPKTAKISTDIALIVQRAGDLPRARTLLEAAVGLTRQAYGDTHDEVARALAGLVAVTEGLADTEAAEAARRELAQIRPDAQPSEPQAPDTDAAAPDRPVPAAEPPPAGKRLTAPDLDRFGSGWLERISPEDLPVLADRLAELADRLERAGEPEQAVRAIREAVRAEHRFIEQLTDDELAGTDRWQPYADRTSQLTRLLAETGQMQELMRIGEDMAGLQHRLGAWQARLQEATQRQVAEADRRFAPVQRRMELQRRVYEQRRLAQRRHAAIVRRMAGDPAPAGVVSLPPAGSRAVRDDARDRIESAFRSGQAVVLSGDPELDGGGLDGAGTGQLALAYARGDTAELRWWVDARTRLTLLHGLARLGERLGLAVDHPADLTANADAVIGALRQRTDWLLVLGDAVYTDLVERIARTGTGRVLVATADPAVTPLGATVEVGALEPGTVAGSLPAGSEQVVERLGGLPLAVDLAAAYLGETGSDADGYLTRLDDARQRLWVRDLPGGRLAPAVLACLVCLEHLEVASPAALELLRLCSFLDVHTDLPLDRLTAPSGLLPEALQAAATSDLGLAEPLGHLTRLGLLARDGTGGRVHPLVAAVVRRRLAPEPASQCQEYAATLVLAAFPYLGSHHTGGARLSAEDLAQAGRMAPHAAALVDHPALTDPALAVSLLDQLGWYLTRRGETTAAVVVLRRAQQLRDETYPADDAESVEARNRLVDLMHAAGEDAAVPAVPDRPEGEPVSTADADALHAMAVQLLKTGNRTAARSTLEQELAIREQVNGPDSPEVARLLRELSISLFLPDRDYERARAALERAVLITEAQRGPQTVEVWTVLGDLALVLWQQEDPAALRPVLERRREVAESLHGPHSRITAHCLEQLAEVQTALGDLPDAAAALTRAVEIYERGGPGPEADRSRHALVNVLLETGDTAAVRATYYGLVAARQERGGPAADTSVELLEELVAVARATGDLASARAAQERVVGAHERSHGPIAAEVAAALATLVVILAELGEHQAARAAAERAVGIDEQMGDRGHAGLARDLANLATVLERSQDLRAARSALERAAELAETTYGGDHLEVARVLARLGKVHHGMSDPAAARAAAERALAIYERRLGTDHPETQRVAAQLGDHIA